MQVSKGPFTFEAAHRLQDYNGNCRNLHGHSYQVFVHIRGLALQESGPQRGMLLDFKTLSEWWKPIELMLDHKTILEEGDPLIAAIAPYVAVHTVDFAPTAENLAVWLHEDLVGFVRDFVDIDATGWQFSVQVYETAKAWATAP